MVEEVLWSTTQPAMFKVPHRIELVRSAVLPPVDKITSAFVLVLDRFERVLMAYVDRPGRGWDVPGGHLEPGETPHTAAVRELREETGFVLAEEDLSVAGWTRISLDERPAGYRYPYPVGYMVFFLARGDHDGPATEPEADSECTAADWLTTAEIEQRCVDPDWLPLLNEPQRGGNEADAR
ncbi:NUDIX hydrolase [Actinopolymorpha sp. B9G3]|uniref:NUDIX hydrolase n=1 Tax=Actinopolymorpha sp. B9G3 TaxID=3158970 RepID=UPI0032D8DD10